ncbi:MAG: hypothetical protein JSS72_03935 [Armatimonadetes bacterium]|nr:hypothetical protein [Armatimonadota bacterium]
MKSYSTLSIALALCFGGQSFLTASDQGSPQNPTPQTDVVAPEPTKVDLGAVFDEVWFSHLHPTRPLVAIKVPLDKLKLAALSNGVNAKAFDAAIKKAGDEPSSLVVVKNPVYTAQTYVIVSAKPDGNNLVVILQNLSNKEQNYKPDSERPAANQLISSSYNCKYLIDFTFMVDAKQVSGENLKSNSIVLEHNKLVGFTSRFSASSGTDFSKKSATLISAGKNDDGTFKTTKDDKTSKYSITFDTAQATQYSVNIGYAAFTNFLQKALFCEDSYYEFSAALTISDQKYDPKSNITLQGKGVTNLVRGPAILINAWTLQTTQAGITGQLFAEPGLRFGDRRSHGLGIGKVYEKYNSMLPYSGDASPVPKDAFFPASKTLDPIYLELTCRLGTKWTNSNSDVPDPTTFDPITGIVMPYRRSQEGLVVPKITVGFSDFLGESSLVHITGTASASYARHRWGAGSDQDGYKNEFDITTSLGNNKEIAFQVSGGTNPAQGYVKVKPTYSLKFNLKF